MSFVFVIYLTWGFPLVCMSYSFTYCVHSKLIFQSLLFSVYFKNNILNSIKISNVLRYICSHWHFLSRVKIVFSTVEYHSCVLVNVIIFNCMQQKFWKNKLKSESLNFHKNRGIDVFKNIIKKSHYDLSWCLRCYMNDPVFIKPLGIIY